MAPLLERLDSARRLLEARVARAFAELLGSRDRYRLVSRLGRGGMGEVWLAEDRDLGRRVAVKLARSDGQRTPTSPERFEREIRVTMGLGHPHTVRIYDHGTTARGTRYYAMELLEGRNLAELLSDEGPLAPKRAAELLCQAASALAEAHQKGLVHRDVKLENLVLDEGNGRPDFLKVLDFGLVLGLADPRITVEGMCAGSPSYISPEVILGGLADARSDVYALGCVLYSLLTGRPPFIGASNWDVLSGHLHQEPLPPSARSVRDVPESLDRLVLRCLEKDPTWRPADAGVLFDELVRFLRTPAPPIPNAWADEDSLGQDPFEAERFDEDLFDSEEDDEDPFGEDLAEAHTTLHLGPAPAADFDDLVTRDVCGASSLMEIDSTWALETVEEPPREHHGLDLARARDAA